jgi:phenylalanyl-tRNA synthetase beta chain
MIISYKWLLDYLPEPIAIEELSKILTSIGLEVEATEAVEAVKGGLEGLVTGEVLTCEKHPNADKLSVTTVNVGTGTPLHIVCGAPNVAAGQKVIVAVVGTTVHPTEGEPFLIKKAKIRGEESEGMICAEDEIGLGKSHAGIMILPEDTPIGIPAKIYFNIPETDHAIHIGLTPNRSDAMSHIGVARDVCAYLTHHNDKKYAVRQPQVALPAKGNSRIDIKVNIEATEACPRYTGISIANVKIGPSPEWLQQRLTAIDVRPINNVVDITNYVLHEYGQPLHAFDADKIKGNTINVRLLSEGSKFVTLDGKERTLKASDLMICDAEEGMCIAGVFGGLHSGVSDSTANIFLESAYFTAGYIRRTSLHHGLRTDAATHFEKGVDINNVLPALKRAATLITEVAGGSITSDIIDVYVKPIQPVTVNVSYAYIQKLSGKDYSPTAIKDVLLALGFEIETETTEALTLKVPSNKTDVSQPADIVEEVLRIDGLDNIAIPEKLNISLVKALPNDRAEKEKLAEALCGLGFQEIVTNSIVNSKFYPERTDLVRMLNSLTAELDVMRPSMLESGLEVIQYNYNRKNQDLSLFEFGRVYRQEEGKYIEDPRLALWITGNVSTSHWNNKAQAADLFYVKGVINNLLKISGIGNAATSYDDASAQVSLNWKWKNQPLCSLIKVPVKQAEAFDIKQEVYFGVINWALWQKAMSTNKIKYKEVPKFPAVQRDLAIVLDKAVSYQQVQQITDQLKIDALQSFDLFDVFESEKLGAGKKSYALSYTFQLQDRTLTDVEIEQVMQQLSGAYKNKLQAQIRE